MLKALVDGISEVAWTARRIGDRVSAAAEALRRAQERMAALGAPTQLTAPDPALVEAASTPLPYGTARYEAATQQAAAIKALQEYQRAQAAATSVTAAAAAVMEELANTYVAIDFPRPPAVTEPPTVAPDGAPVFPPAPPSARGSDGRPLFADFWRNGLLAAAGCRRSNCCGRSCPARQSRLRRNRAAGPGADRWRRHRWRHRWRRNRAGWSRFGRAGRITVRCGHRSAARRQGERGRGAAARTAVAVSAPAAASGVGGIGDPGGIGGGGRGGVGVLGDVGFGPGFGGAGGYDGADAGLAPAVGQSSLAPVISPAEATAMAGAGLGPGGAGPAAAGVIPPFLGGFAPPGGGDLGRMGASSIGAWLIGEVEEFGVRTPVVPEVID
jgi:hypothetical protein